MIDDDEGEVTSPPENWAEQLLHFWFVEHGFADWFKGGADFDKAVTEHFAVIPLIVDQFVFVRGSNVQGAYVNGTFTGYYDIATVSLKG